jgi:hypothetical protein
MCCALRVDRPAASLPEDVDALRALALEAIAERDAAIAERDRLMAKRPHKSARASTCNDAASGNKIQSFVFHNLSIRNCWHPHYCSAIESA